MIFAIIGDCSIFVNLFSGGEGQQLQNHTRIKEGVGKNNNEKEKKLDKDTIILTTKLFGDSYKSFQGQRHLRIRGCIRGRFIRSWMRTYSVVASWEAVAYLKGQCWYSQEPPRPWRPGQGQGPPTTKPWRLMEASKLPPVLSVIWRVDLVKAVHKSLESS